MGEQSMTIALNGSDLTVTQVVAAARHGEAVTLAPEAMAAMRRSRAVVQDVLAGGEPVYGLTTGCWRAPRARPPGTISAPSC
jgi:histidine ammonia-lyase